ncbi:MAG: KH domain-containing protein [Eubacteriales bacterium]|nr:KH domain-containing protein [Eubacteriales bacterium]
MDELVRYIVKSLVSDPEAATVEMHEEDDSYVIEVSVAQNDIGKVIGKQGRIAKAIRTVVKAASINSDKKYMVEIL